MKDPFKPSEAAIKKMNKYHARRTYSMLCDRWIDSKAEAHRAEELTIAQKGGAISGLEFQIKFVLSKAPKVTIRIDFGYVEDGQMVYEDVKGVLTRDFRTKLAWLKEKFGIEVRLIR